MNAEALIELLSLRPHTGDQILGQSLGLRHLLFCAASDGKMQWILRGVLPSTTRSKASELDRRVRRIANVVWILVIRAD